MATAAVSGTTQIQEPEKLKSAGQGANEMAGSVKAAGSLAEESTRAAAGSLKGDTWTGALGSTMDRALQTWQSQTTSLVNKCRSLHDKCTATADNYTRTEAANTQAMASVRAYEPTPFG